MPCYGASNNSPVQGEVSDGDVAGGLQKETKKSYTDKEYMIQYIYWINQMGRNIESSLWAI